MTAARSLDELVTLVGRLNWTLAAVAGLGLLIGVGLGMVRRARRGPEGRGGGGRSHSMPPSGP